MKYTALDIHRMRAAVRTIGVAEMNRSYNPDELERTVEMRLVTYMSNETTADELEQEAERVFQLARARR